MEIAVQNRFARKQLHDWLLSMPDESIRRLRTINENTGSARHVILTLAFSIVDGNIRSLSRMITGLLISRMKAERADDQATIERINEYMKGMHESIDAVTGVHRALNGSRHACNRIAGKLARGH